MLEFKQSQWLKPYIEFDTHKRLEAEKNGDKNRKSLYKLLRNAAYCKTTENLKCRIDSELASNKKEYLKWTKLYVTKNI